MSIDVEYCSLYSSVSQSTKVNILIVSKIHDIIIQQHYQITVFGDIICLKLLPKKKQAKKEVKYQIKITGPQIHNTSIYFAR